MDTVFEVFEQADSSIARKHGGSGLGLAICKQLIEIMQGSIGVKARDKGSEFWIELQLATIKPLATVKTVIAPGQIKQNTSIQKILVAEDNEVNTLYIVSLLKETGNQIDNVSTGKEAFLAATRTAYDLILMDIHMPDMDGITAAQEIRSRGIMTPIITISADVSSTILEKIQTSWHQ